MKIPSVAVNNKQKRNPFRNSVYKLSFIPENPPGFIRNPEMAVVLDSCFRRNAFADS
jgi:hypothetical protein